MGPSTQQVLKNYLLNEELNESNRERRALSLHFHCQDKTETSSCMTVKIKGAAGKVPGAGPPHKVPVKSQSTPRSAQMRSQTELGFKTVTHYMHIIRWHFHFLPNSQAHM